MLSPPVDPPAMQQPSCHHDAPPDRYHTCVNDHHAAYSENNLPPLLFRMEAPAFDDLPPLRNLVENGQVVQDRDGRPIRAFPFLPRYISIRPAGWLLEYWMRTDPRLTYRDITSRMAAAPAPAAQRPRENSLNMRRERECRNPLALSCWTSYRSTVGRVEVERVARWSLDQIRYNTTMEIEYDQRRRTAVRLRSRTLAGGVPAYHSLDLFLDGGEAHVPGRRIREALSLFWRLSERASRLQLSSWKLLPADELPEAWRRRTQRGNMGGEGDVEAGSSQPDTV